MAMVIPVEIPSGKSRGPVVLIVILTRDNLERMQTGDPFDLRLTPYEGHVNLDRPLRDLDLVVAYEEDEKQIVRLAAEGGLPAIMSHLERNRRHLAGDTAPPVSIKPPHRRPQ